MSTTDQNVWSLYVGDANLALQEIEQSLLALESDGSSPEEINRLYRALHTIKGNSALLELSQIEALAHCAEDVAGFVRDAGVTLNRETIDLMLGVVDVLRSGVEHVGQTHGDMPADAVAPQLALLRVWQAAHNAQPRERVRTDPDDGGVHLFSDPPGQGSSPEPRLSKKPSRASKLAPPPRQSKKPTPAAADSDMLVMVLGLAHELCFPNGALLSTADELRALLDDLKPAAERVGLRRLAAALDGLRGALGTGDAPIPSVKLAPLLRALIELEAQYRAQSSQPKHFDFAALSEKVLAAAAAEAPPTEAGNRGRGDGAARHNFLRVDARKVSYVMDLVGEIGLACGAVTHHPDLEDKELEGFSAAAHKLEMLVRELQSEISGMRLVPIATVFQAMKRVARDTARRTGKQVDLVISGETTEIDKVMVDALHDPLVHLIRNAIDHGLESTEDRIAAGKPATGRVMLDASHQGGEVLVRVSDDGRGIQRKRILARAKERGIISESAVLSDQQTLDLIFLPGFSTKENIDEVSGRGVGMDLIKTAIESQRGRIRMQSVEGQGSTIELTLPLTLAFLDAMVVREGDQLYAVPIEKVREVFTAHPEHVCHASAEGKTMLRVRDELVPMVRLGDYYAHKDFSSTLQAGSVIMVVQTPRGQLAIPVDALLGNQPVTLKPLKGVLSHVRAAAGCGMLRTGDVALTLDCDQLHV